MNRSPATGKLENTARRPKQFANHLFLALCKNPLLSFYKPPLQPKRGPSHSSGRFPQSRFRVFMIFHELDCFLLAAALQNGENHGFDPKCRNNNNRVLDLFSKDPLMKTWRNASWYCRNGNKFSLRYWRRKDQTGASCVTGGGKTKLDNCQKFSHKSTGSEGVSTKTISQMFAKRKRFSAIIEPLHLLENDLASTISPTPPFSQNKWGKWCCSFASRKGHLKML